MSITDMTVEQELMLIEWIRETYYGHQKMMENQLYQLKLKLVKWRTMEDDEVKAGDLMWEGILVNCLMLRKLTLNTPST
eukprot:COSAG05_NODE_4054_length_1696_cov_3.380088_2_plen_79_part_00